MAVFERGARRGQVGLKSLPALTCIHALPRCKMSSVRYFFGR
jgi:hypothetical protein